MVTTQKANQSNGVQSRVPAGFLSKSFTRHDNIRATLLQVSPTHPPPRVSSASRLSGPTDGLDATSGDAIEIVLSGANLGLPSLPGFDSNSAGVSFLAAAGDPYALSVRAGYVGGLITAWSHDSITFKLPQGQGSSLLLAVTAGGQSSTDGAAGSTDVYFSYDAPSVDGVLYPDPEKRGDGSFLPTSGGYNVTLRGRSLGQHFGRIELAHGMQGFACGAVDLVTGRRAYASSCTVALVAHSHREVRFIMPRGVGADFTVRLAVGASKTDPIGASYDPPSVSFVLPNVLLTKRDQPGTVQLHGSNFGDNVRDVRISVHGADCDNTQLFAGAVDSASGMPLPPYVQCSVPPAAVGRKNLTLSVAGQNVSYPFWVPKLTTYCSTNFYGLESELCLECPRGAYCDGMLAEPTAIGGWWLQNATGEQCHELRRPPASPRAYCPQLVPCEPRWACNGSNVCNLGYAGERCALCADGYFRRAGECAECPDNPALLILGFLVAALIACVAGYFLNKHSVNLAFVSIGVDYFQILAIFANSRVSWPPFIKEVFHIMSVFNFNLEITAPECTLPDLGYATKWFFIQALPLAAVAVFLIMHVAIWVKKVVTGQRKRRNNHVKLLVGTGLVMFYYLYLYLTRTTLDVFNCAPTDPPDGHEYLEVVFERCDKPGGLHRTLLPFAIITLAMYTIGYPLAVGVLLYRKRYLVMEDQLLRAKDTGRTRLTNPHAYDFRRKYHKVYYQFKPDYYYWILAILARKGLIAFTALMFNKNPAFQLSVALLVMFVCYAMQVRYKPYMSPSEHEAVLQAHAVAATDVRSPHFKLQQTLKSVAQRGRRKAHTVSWAQEHSLRNAASAAANFFWNYNTVESVLLFCAVIVNLAGVMFESGRFESEYYHTQRDFIATVVLLVIFVSILYFFTVLVSEVYITVFKPKRKRNTKGKKTHKGGKAAASSIMVPDGHGGFEMREMGAPRLTMAGMGGDDDSAGGMNPIFQLAQRKADENVDDTIASEQPPNARQWGVLRTEITKLRANLATAVQELADAKAHNARIAAATAAESALLSSRPGARRSQFAPQRSMKAQVGSGRRGRSRRTRGGGARARAGGASRKGAGVGASSSAAPPPPPPSE